MQRYKKQLGFSLFEVVVTMSIVAIFIAACTNVFTQKFKGKSSSPIHGKYECYYNSAGTLMQKYNKSTPTPVTTPYCSFSPNNAVAYYIINAVGGGGAGGSILGGAKGEYNSVFMTTLNSELKLYPGKGAVSGSSEKRGERTYILAKQLTGEEREILSVEGGLSASGTNVNLENCNVAFAEYACTLVPKCTSDNETRTVKVEYCSEICADSTCWAEDTVTFNTILALYSSGIPSSKDIYYNNELGGYTIHLSVEGNSTENEDVSGMMDYFEALETQESTGVYTEHAGNGGAKEQKGKNGAIVIVW